MAKGDSSYFIRVRGRILGPYDVAQLKTLRSRGQFSRANEISTDRLNWQSAAALDHLWGNEPSSKKPQAATQTTAVPDVTAPPSRSMTPVWYYAVGSEQFGPVTLLELRGMLASNQLMPTDPVWKEGLPEWLPASGVSELNVVTKATAVPHPQSGGAQHFCFACGAPTDSRAEICPKCGVRQIQNAIHPEKNRLTAALLAMFLGGLGIHHFYLGNTLLGVIYLLFVWTFIPAIVAFIESIVFLCMSDATFAVKYGSNRAAA